MRLWVTRPEPDAAEQARALERLGHAALVEPLLSIRFRDEEPLPRGAVQAVLATSRNGLRALARRRESKRLLAAPLFAVGGATAALGREMGFAHVVEASGTGESLAELVAAQARPDAGLLLHLAGDRLAFDLGRALAARGFDVAQPAVYASVARRQLTKATQDVIRASDLHGIILMSPRTAHVYARLMQRHGLAGAARGLRHFCLSPAVAEQLAPLPGVKGEAAPAPRQAELLALIGEATAH